ncbi:hypothetical protein [uncultured Dysosmobacter sp.]|uniref:hypothetical protein n=1 Tax=uncultured Dysosmobacter sp. TaxID=2591384 RepID=UPI00260E9DEF|nr:hypothetical protein [uncultured Dysosmobacter sp.]
MCFDTLSEQRATRFFRASSAAGGVILVAGRQRDAPQSKTFLKFLIRKQYDKLTSSAHT